MVSNNNVLNQFRGLVKPIVKRKMTPPAHINAINLSLAGKYFTTLRVWVHHPNKEYPEYGIFLSLSNGNSSTFCRLQNVEEFTSLSNFIQSENTVIHDLLPQLEAESRIFQQAQETYENQLRVLQAMANSQPPDDNDFIEEENG